MNIFDNHAGPNLRRENILETCWIQAIGVNNGISLLRKSNQRVGNLETVILDVGMADTRIGVLSRVIRNTKVLIFPWTIFIVRLLKQFLPPKHKIVL